MLFLISTEVQCVCRELPAECEVTFPELFDVFLVDTYNNLPNLKCVMLCRSSGKNLLVFYQVGWIDPMERCPWSRVLHLFLLGEFHPKHSLWVSQFSSSLCLSLIRIEFRSIFKALTFKSSGRFINPSRASPLEVYSTHTATDGSRAVIYAANTMAVMVTSIYTVGSCLHRSPTVGLAVHSVEGIPHQQEAQRLQAFIPMVFGYDMMNAQISKGAMSFVTKIEGAPAPGESASYCPVIASHPDCVCIQFRPLLVKHLLPCSAMWSVLQLPRFFEQPLRPGPEGL